MNVGSDVEGPRHGRRTRMTLDSSVWRGEDKDDARRLDVEGGGQGRRLVA
jgi:hypothetical protein